MKEHILITNHDETAEQGSNSQHGEGAILCQSCSLDVCPGSTHCAFPRVPKLGVDLELGDLIFKVEQEQVSASTQS